MSRRASTTILLFIILFGVLLRSYLLTSRSLWFDEAFSWRLIQFPFSEMLQRAAQDVHPPLYYIILKAWGVVFGTSILSLRSFSVTLAALTIFLAYRFTYEAVGSRYTGLLAATLIALSGFQIQFAWEARMYTLGTALLLLSSWLLLKAIRSAYRPNYSKALFLWLSYALAAVALAYIHYYSFFSLAAQAIFIVGYILIHTKCRIGEIIQWRLTWYTIMSAAIILLIYAPQIPIFLNQNSQVQQSYWIPTIGGWSVPDTFYRMFIPTAGIPAHSGPLHLILAVLPAAFTIIIWIVVVLPLPDKRQNYTGWLVALLGFIPFVIAISISLISQSLYQDRFFIFAHLFVLIGLALLIGRIKLNSLKYAITSLVIVWFLAALVSYWLEIDIPSKPGARAAAAYVYGQPSGSEPVIVSSPFIFFSIAHYAGAYPQSYQPRLYSDTGQLLHFAGGPILKQSDVVSSSIFESTNKLWVIDTTGFGSSKLKVPAAWAAVETKTYPEVFAYQGNVIVTEYKRITGN